MKCELRAPLAKRSHLTESGLRCCLVLVVCVASGCGVAPVKVKAPAKAKAPTKGKASAEFDQARSLVHGGDFDNATKTFDKFLAAHPKHKLASRAVFLRAKCELGRHQIEAAQLGFRDVIARFPLSEEARKAEFKLAMIEYLNGNLVDARMQFEAIAAAASGPYTPEACAWAKHLRDGLQGNE